jgi:hypothetical protein
VGSVLSYDLHVHPGPSVAPRWGTGREVWEAAAAEGVLGFVWKSHEHHTIACCHELPEAPVRAIGSASLNPWSAFDDVRAAIEDGAAWLWGPTLDAVGDIGWELELPAYWPRLATWLGEREGPLVLGTGHLGPEGRCAFAELAARSVHHCSITHSLYVPPDEVAALAGLGCMFEVDAYTLSRDLAGRTRVPPEKTVGSLLEMGSCVYFTSDGGQQATGNPFLFAGRVLEELEARIGSVAARAIGVENPAAVVATLQL